MDIITEALCQCALFNGLNRAEIQNAFSTVEYRIREYDKNEFICREDQSTENIGIIIFGRVKIQKNLPSGKMFCISYNNVGDIFGGCVAFSGSTSYPCDIFSSEKSKILFFHKHCFFELCKEPQIAENIMGVVSKRMLYFENKLELFSYSSIQKKIAYYLLNEMRISGGCTVNLPFSKKLWAEYLNVSRPSLCREIKKLRCSNIIEIEKDKITVLDEKRLAGLLEY